MKRDRILGALVVLVILLQVSCGQPTASPPAPTKEVVGGPVQAGYEQVVDALRAQGATVEVVGRQDATYFAGDGYEILVNGASLRVFVYADEAARQADSDSISPDGWEITRQDGETTVVSHLEWIQQPNFWAQERVMVLYVGSDEATQRLLSATLGEPLTAPTLLAEGYPRAALQAQEMARMVSSVADVQIEIVSYEPVTWEDSCLGAALEGDACAEVMTPGWIVVLRGPGGEYAMHTDLFGERMRRGADLAGAPEPTPTAGILTGPTAAPSVTVVVPTPTPLVPTPTVMVPTPTPLVPTPTMAPGGLAVYSNPIFGVSFLYPDHWQPLEGDPETGERYGGHNGFFLVGAMDAGDRPLDDVAAQEAGHVLRPYGTDPSIESLVVAGQEARLILPSADQAMGPLGQAILIVRYPAPVEVGGHVYPLFTLTADPGHIRELVWSLGFITN